MSGATAAPPYVKFGIRWISNMPHGSAVVPTKKEALVLTEQKVR